MWKLSPEFQGCTALGLISSLFFVAMCLMASAAGEDAVYRRLLMTDNSSETGMHDCIKQAAAAASQEDLETYVSCFTDSQRKQLRRKAALLFVRHTVTLELIDCHLVEETDSHATWAVKYKALLTDAGYDVVSLLHMHKENNEWKIRREEVETSERSQPAYESDSLRRGGCAGGQCRLVAQY
jgi:hypothetical protein